MLRLARLLPLAGLAACADAGTAPFDLATRHAPIVGGVPAEAPLHDAVVALHHRVGDEVFAQPFCSGTLITPSVVLTAAHCLDAAEDGAPRAEPRAPQSVGVYFGAAPATDPAPTVYGVTDVRLYGTWDSTRLINDIALLRLARPVPTEIATPIPPLPPALGFGPADAGEPLDLIGFGTDGEHAGVKLHAELPLAGLGCRLPGCPTRGWPARMISYGGGGTTPCNGDSGGPALVRRDGRAYVGGVTSYGDRHCARFAVSTRVDAYAPFIAGFVFGGGECESDGACQPACGADVDPDCGE